MSAGGAMNRVTVNASSMHNGLESTQSIKHCDWCCGIHGAARFRRGLKRGTSAARRRLDKKVIVEASER
mgnify:CR=1 FL=1